MQNPDLFPQSPSAPALYMPKPSPFAGETPEARRARHLRRFRQVKAGNVDAPLEIPGQPRVDLAAKAPQSAAPPLIARVPYPQTPETARAWIKAHGVAITDLAHMNGLPRLALSDLLRGQRGQAHHAAVVLGLKPDPSQTTA